MAHCRPGAPGARMLTLFNPDALTMTNRFISSARALAAQAAELFAGLSEFQQRIWVVSIVNEGYSDTFIVNEGNFEEPMQWMVRKGYDAEMLRRVNDMKRSQAIQLDLGRISHRLMRVK